VKKFMDEDFMLQTPFASRLYHGYAENLPIIDYHCHLIPQQIAEDKRYQNITEVWLGGDHYKWRAMRGNGVDEKFITGDASDYEKFQKWAETMPYTIGNPLYHWTHLELKRYFGVDEPFSGKNCKAVWDQCNAVLASPEFSARGIIKRSNVETICTTDDPCDDLRYHKAVAADASFGVTVLPTFRPDKAININKPEYAAYMTNLANICGKTIQNLDDVKACLSDRLDFFQSLGCRISDHALGTVEFAEPDEKIVNEAIASAMKGETPDAAHIAAYRTALLLFLGEEYARRNMAMQIHIGALRDVNTRMYRILGPDTGYDAIQKPVDAEALAQIMDRLEVNGNMPKVVLYSLNPYDHEVLIALATCYNNSDAPGKVQLGSGWWFNDQKHGMISQMTALADIGLLSKFIGMLTDSRSFLSYTRHEYFRRILCNLIGQWVEDGELPADEEMLGGIVADISYHNAKKYLFG